METDDLIRTLSHDAKAPGGVSTRRTLLLCVAGALAWCVIAILVTRGVRPDFALAAPWVGLKAGLSLLFALSAFPLVLRLARPGQNAGLALKVGVGVTALALVVALVAVMLAAPQDRMDAVTGGGFPHSVVVIPTLAIPAAAILFFWFRTRAPTRLMLAGAAAGVLAGGLSAMAYALICPVDSVAFIATWYTLAIAVCAAAGAIIGAWALRW